MKTVTLEIPDDAEVYVMRNFGELLYWLERCNDKGHLDNCYDLVEPFANLEIIPTKIQSTS